MRIHTSGRASRLLSNVGSTMYTCHWDIVSGLAVTCSVVGESISSTPYVCVSVRPGGQRSCIANISHVGYDVSLLQRSKSDRSLIRSFQFSSSPSSSCFISSACSSRTHQSFITLMFCFRTQSEFKLNCSRMKVNCICLTCILLLHLLFYEFINYCLLWLILYLP